METKIEMGKQYRTRGGIDARILCTDRRDSDYPVVAMIDTHVSTFTADGLSIKGDKTPSDLIEVKPRIVREYWTNVYPNGMGAMYSTKAQAAAERGDTCQACVKITIDCEEGEGLNNGT